MDFKLTEEQELVRENMRDFGRTYVDPIAVEIDENSRFPAEVIQKLGEGGWMGMPIPQEYGGAGTDYLTYAIAVEELSYCCAATGFTMSVHTGLVAMPLYLFGSEEQKQKYLVPLAKGEHLGAFALTEPGAGTDVGAATSTAVLDGDQWVINGTKTFCSNGPVADTYVTFAWVEKEEGGRAMTCFVVPKGTPGMRVGAHFAKMGLRASQTSEIIFKDCRIPKDNLVGKIGDGLKIAMNSFDHGRIGIAAQAVGIIQAALDESIKYSKQRIQFNKPISKNQAVQWWIADMATEVAAARFMVYNACYLKDQGKSFSKEAAMAKLFAAECSMRHTVKAVQVYGGYGYIKGQKVERLMRDAKITEIYEGTSEAQRMVIAGNVLR